MRVLPAASLLALLLGGCSLFHDEYPSGSCRVNTECFQAQGEHCNTVTRRCEPRPDAAPPIDARPPRPDANLPDAAELPDADELPDAETIDGPT